MDSAPLEGGAPPSAVAARHDRIVFDERSELRGDIVAGHEPQNAPVEALDERSFGPAQPDSILGQRLEDGLEIEGGPADDFEELAGRRLLL
jgi:hypothetical protein